MSFLRFWWDAVCQSFGVGWIVIGIASTALPLIVTLLLKYLPQSGNVAWIKWAAGHQAELHVAIAAICVVLYLLVAPFRLYQQERTAKETAQRATSSRSAAPLEVNVSGITDTESRQQIATLKSELASAKETIQRQERDFDPLSKPISSVKFTVALDIAGRNDPGHDIQSPMMLIFSVGDKGILWGTTTEHFEEPGGHRRYIIDVPFDAAQMGQPIHTLADGNSIIMQFTPTMLPLGTKLSGGNVAMVVNNEVTAVFEIPAQTLEHVANEGRPVIILKDIQASLRAVIKPRSSPAPDTEASPP